MKGPGQNKKYVHLSNISKVNTKGLTRLLGLPQPQMYPPVALNQYTWVNRTHKKNFYMLQGPMKILK